ncbi:MAG: type VI secretion system baseplate subunit TssG [Candidatus Binatia bacterium]
MATESWRTDPSLAEELLTEGYRFDFFEAVRVLERLFPHRQAVGRDATPSQEVVRFQTRLALTFPPSAIHEVTEAQDNGKPVAMTVSFMGLTGLLGVLPRHYTELLLERTRKKDFVLRDFLELFNHRFISLFYRAWEKYRFPIAYERNVANRSEYDDFSLHLFDFISMGTKGLRGRLEVGDEALLFYAGLIGQHPHSASALTGILRDYFEVPVDIVQFVGQWLVLTKENRTRLGGEANNALGMTAIAGNRVWDQQAKFRLRLGPLSFAEFHRFLPAGKAFRPLVQFTRYIVGQEFDFDVQLILKAEDVPRCRLGGTGDRAPRLGWTTWLKTKDFTKDAEDAIFSGRLTQVGAMPDG